MFNDFNTKNDFLKTCVCKIDFISVHFYILFLNLFPPLNVTSYFINTVSDTIMNIF